MRNDTRSTLSYAISLFIPFVLPIDSEQWIAGAFDRSEQRGACARVYVERRRLHTQACRIQQTFVKVQSFHKELTQHGSPLLEAALLDTF